jgi:uncharacterized membrane protein HdeD (DUF308 family)
MSEEGKKKHKISLYWRILIVAGVILVAVTVLAMLWPAACDAYTDYVFPYITIPMGWLVNLAPFAVGEILMYAGAVLVIGAVVLSLIYGVKAIVQPGGSIRDEDSVRKADENGITMLFTGERHFKH